MESKTESAHFYSRAFRFATHYPVRFRFYPRLSPFVPLGVGFSCPVPRLREGVPKVKAPKRRRGRIKRPASEEMARLAAHQGWESCCRDGAFGLLPRPLGVGFQRRGPRPPALVPGRGFQRGGPQPAPLCHEGAWGTGGVPHVSGGGLRGRDLCAKGPFPLPRSGNCPLREQTVLSDFQIK